MSLLDAFHHRLSVLLHPRRYASDAEEEMRFHLELETMQQLHAGADEDVARHTARRRFGNVTCITEERRRMSGLSAIDNVTQDLRYALRSLGRNRGFSVAAVLTLALGIGATTAMFSLMNALLFRPLPVAEPDRLFIINEQRVGAIVRWMGAEEMIPYERFLQYREATSSVFTGLAAWKPASFSLHAGSDPATTVQGALVSANYFDVLGLRAAAGRFAHGDDERAVVISYDRAVLHRLPDGRGQKVEDGLRQRRPIGADARQALRNRAAHQHPRRIGLPPRPRHAAFEWLSPLLTIDGIEAGFQDAPLYNSIFRFDDQMLVTPHLFATPGHSAPLFRLRRLCERGLFDRFAGHFEAIWAERRPIGQDRGERLLRSGD